MNDLLSTALTGLAYSGVGFLGGFLVGRGTSAAYEPSTKEKKPFSKRLGIFFIVLSLITVSQSVYFSIKANHETKCLYKIINKRADWATEDREALISFLDAVAVPGSSLESRAKALVELKVTYDRNSIRRAKVSIPTPTNCK